MSNYISINGQRVELTPAQVEQIIAAWTQQRVELIDVAVGDTCKIGEHEFVVLEQLGGETAIICKNFIHDNEEFGKSNNYAGSNVDALCNSFSDDLAALVGRENIVPHAVDLTADDGLKDYGSVERHASLLTADRYRRYVEILDEHKVDDWWWLATPFSTATHGSERLVKCVAPSGRIYDGICNYGGGVRPFCILKSNIFVSK
jgi:hypothetical protein